MKLRTIIFLIISVLIIGTASGTGTYYIVKSNQGIFGAGELWYPSGGFLKPITNSWGINVKDILGTNASLSENLAFYGEIKPDGLTCSNGEILKKTGTNNWDCAADDSAAVSDPLIIGSIQATHTSISDDLTVGSDDISFKGGVASISSTLWVGGAITGSLTGNASTATALFANGANCSANQYPLGVDASGAVESCTVDANTTYTATNPLSLNGTAFTIDVASASGAGVLSAANWTTFNNKISAGDDGLIASDSIDFDDMRDSATLDANWIVGGNYYIQMPHASISDDFSATNKIKGGILSDGTFSVTSGVATGLTSLTSTALIGTHASISDDLTLNGGRITTGNIPLIIGDSLTDSITFTTDGTGNGEYTFSADGIGDVDIDWGSGAGQVDLADFTGGISGAIAWDFGAATSFEIPNAATLTLDSNGELYIDTTAGQLQYYSNGIEVLIATRSYSIEIGNDQMTSSSWIPEIQFTEPFTITDIRCRAKSGTSFEMELLECDANASNCTDVDAKIVCAATTTKDDGSLSNPLIDALDIVIVSTSQGDISGAVQTGSIFIKGKYTPE